MKAVLETTTLLEEGEVPPRVCPFHMATLGPVVNNKGYHLTRCTDQPCLISVFDDQNATSYLNGVYTKSTRIFTNDGENCFVTVVSYQGFVKANRKKPQTGCTWHADTINVSSFAGPMNR